MLDGCTTMSHKDPKPIVVIGAGIVGIATAISLQRRGRSVVVIERDEPGTGSSFGNAGVLAASAIVPVATPSLPRNVLRMLMSPNEPLFVRWGSIPRLTPWLISFLASCTPERVETIARQVHGLTWDAIGEHTALAEQTGAERYIVPCEYWYLYKNHQNFADEAFSWHIRRQCGFMWEEVQGAEMYALQDGLNPEFSLMIRQRDGHGRIADPGAYVAALARYFIRSGGRILRAEAQDFAAQDGRITRVITNEGSVDCASAVLTAGIWSAGLGRKLGIRRQMEGLGGYHVDLWEPSITLKAPTMVPSAKCVISPMENRIRVAGIVELGSVNKPPVRPPFNLLMQGLRKIMPSLTWKEKTEWMGYRPSFSDSLPVLGAAPAYPNAWVAFGHQGVGMTSGARSGRLIAEMICGEKSNIDLLPYSPARI